MHTVICHECGLTYGSEHKHYCEVVAGRARDLLARDLPSRLEIFDKTEQDVKAKMKVYGDPFENFSQISIMKMVIAHCKHPQARHALEMIAEGVCRLIQTPDHLDSWSNIAGYARCGVMVTEPREKTNEKT